jgi:hypothetical protein
MAETKLADLIVPEVFLPYASKRTVEKLALVQSGIMSDLSDVATIVQQRGGITIQMPFLSDLSGEEEIMDDTNDLTVNAIGSDKDVAARLFRAKSFGASDLSGELSGADPIADIADKFADYWAKRIDTLALSVLDGAMAASNMTGNVHDISGLSGAASNFDAEAFIDAGGKLGDMQDELSGVAIHSDTYTSMKKQDLIDFALDSEGNATIPTYMGKRVIVSDRNTKATGPVYTSYIFGSGALGFAQWDPEYGVEAGREPLKGGGMEYIVHRRNFICHVRGVKWAPGSGVPAKPTPSNAELGDGGNWTRVYDPKDIKVVKFVHTLG